MVEQAKRERSISFGKSCGRLEKAIAVCDRADPASGASRYNNWAHRQAANTVVHCMASHSNQKCDCFKEFAKYSYKKELLAGAPYEEFANIERDLNFLWICRRCNGRFEYRCHDARQGLGQGNGSKV